MRMQHISLKKSKQRSNAYCEESIFCPATILPFQQTMGDGKHNSKVTFRTNAVRRNKMLSKAVSDGGGATFLSIRS